MAELDSLLAGGVPILIHAIEGGFQLGRESAEVRSNVKTLADLGIAYVTVAHLFFRGVATNAPALPFLSDSVYNHVFPQAKDEGLTALGHEVVDAMVDEGILVDITHMRSQSIRDVMAQLDARDPAKEIPVIGTHMAYRFGGLQYSFDDETIKAVAARGGVLGCILCEHFITSGLPSVSSLEGSLEALCRHIDKVRELTGSYDHVAIGSDLDGYIKPALPGLEDMSRMTKLQDHLRARYGAADADKICNANALRVLRADWGRKRPRIAIDPSTDASRIEIGTLGGASNDLVGEEDQLGFTDYVGALSDLITSPFTLPPLTIGLFGSWGMGKSFLLKHIEREIGRRQQAQDDGERIKVGPRIHVLAFNAWEYNATDHVWPGLVRKILEKLDQDVPWPHYKRWWARLKWNVPRAVRRLQAPLIAAALVTGATLAASIWTNRTKLAAAIGLTAGGLSLAGLYTAAKNPIATCVTALLSDSDYGREISDMVQIKHDLETLEARLHRRGDRGAEITHRILILIDDLSPPDRRREQTRQEDPARLPHPARPNPKLPFSSPTQSSRLSIV